MISSTSRCEELVQFSQMLSTSYFPISKDLNHHTCLRTSVVDSVIMSSKSACPRSPARSLSSTTRAQFIAASPHAEEPAAPLYWLLPCATTWLTSLPLEIACRVSEVIVPKGQWRCDTGRADAACPSIPTKCSIGTSRNLVPSTLIEFQNMIYALQDAVKGRISILLSA